MAELTLSDKSFKRDIGSAHNTEAEWYETGKMVQLKHNQAQLSHTLNRFRQALRDSKDGKELDLSEEEFEIFSLAIQNDGIAKRKVTNG